MIELFEQGKKSQCCGCTACFSICPVKAITLMPDEEGFLYPEIDSEKCIECKKCICVCPLKTSRKNTLETQNFYAVKHNKKDIVLKSSSGGFFTAVSDWILDQGGVIYGVVFDEKIHAVHMRANSKEMRDCMRGSKYLQSDMGDSYKKVKEDLNNGIPVLFTGTPCQVDGIYKYLGKDYDNFYTMDLICHGVPSPLMFSEHIKNIEKRHREKVVHYKCRSKVNGWHIHTEEAFFESGKSEAGTRLLNRHKRLFYGGYILRPSCYECQYTNLKRPSDITMGDFWGIEEAMPDWDDQLGTSMILVNTQKGQELLGYVKPDITLCESKTYGRQPQLEESAGKAFKREIFWKMYQKYGYRYVSAKYGNTSFKVRVKCMVKKLLGM